MGSLIAVTTLFHSLRSSSLAFMLHIHSNCNVQMVTSIASSGRKRTEGEPHESQSSRVSRVPLTMSAACSVDDQVLDVSLNALHVNIDVAHVTAFR